MNSAHLMDMGGMVMGSWAPAATECYQEAIRFPPVRLFRAGVEEPDVFAIFRNNVRLSALVEMDLRALVAGCHVAEDKLVDVVAQMGVAEFRTAVRALCDSGERELRRRIEALADGVYRVETWTEWGEELYAVPVTLTVAGDRLIFDFTGTSPQAPHFFNSKPYIIESELVADVCTLLCQDLPFSAGLFRPFELRCPEGSIVNSAPPAPVASAHMDAAFCAATVGTQAVVLALAASPGAFGRQHLSGPSGTSGLATHTWGCQVDGAFDGWAMLDGCLPAPSAGHDRDGNDLFSFLVGRQGIVEFIDVEILESWYPLLVHEKKPRPGAFGAGTFRSGAGCQMSYEPYGTDALHGVMLAMRERLPLTGMAGGFPGATTSFRIHRADGTVEAVDGHAMDVVVRDGDTFEFLCASGGGWGDPLERDPALVAHDVALGRITADDAGAVYGVELDGDGVPAADATARRRHEILADRLARARPAANPVPAEPPPDPDVDADAPLYPGVIQRGRWAVSEQTGAVLAIAPDHWTDGCPVIEEHLSYGRLELVVETYLDPPLGPHARRRRAPSRRATHVHERAGPLGRRCGGPMPSADEIRDAQRATWAGLSAGWEKWDSVIMDQLGPVGAAIIERLDIAEDHQHLDIAAGTGEPGLSIARRVPEGTRRADGPRRGDAGHRRATRQAQGIANIETLVCSADDLPFDDATFDGVSVRFGYMFFPDVAKATAEFARVLKPGGRLCSSVWVRPEENPWTAIAMQAIATEVAVASPDPDGPNMFRCAAPGCVSALYEAAGLRDVAEWDVAVELVTRSPAEYWEMISEHVSLAVAALEQVDEPARQRVRAVAIAKVSAFEKDGKVRVPGVARCIVGTKPDARGTPRHATARPGARLPASGGDGSPEPATT